MVTTADTGTTVAGSDAAPGLGPGLGSGLSAARRAELPLYQEIADNARLVTGARYVHFSWFDPATLAVRVGGMSSRETPFLQRGLDLIHCVFPDWDPSQVGFRADVNPGNAAVFLDRKTVHVPLQDIVAGTVHPYIAHLARTVVGMRWCFACPVEVQGEVAGSLALHGPRPFTETQQHACVAFARQAALTLENARLLRAVREHAAEAQQSRRLLAEAEDKQRREVAQLLASRVHSQLLVVSNLLGQCQTAWPQAPAELLAQLSRARDELERIGEQEMRRASQLLHPSIIAVGLAPALRALADRFEGRLTVDVQVRSELRDLDDPVASRVPERVRLAAYRVVEEALANVARHAGVCDAQVVLDADPSARLRILVRDGGRGFDPARPSDGLGLRAIASRVEQVAGEWGVTSAPGQGTTLWCLLPLAPPAPPDRPAS